MQIIKIDQNKIENGQIDLIVESLKRGEVIVYPTDTVYGLGCDARNVEAIKRINKIKGERQLKPFLVLVSDFNMLHKYCFANLEQMEYLKKVWFTPASQAGPGPVTVILKRRPNLPDELTAGQNSLAVRLPQDDFLIKMIGAAGFPIVSTSLNLKGEKPLCSVKKVESHFKYKPDLIIDAGECKTTKPSKLVDLRDIKNIKVIRK